MNLLLEQADRMLKGHGFDYAFCGGYAIDLFLGYESRKHGDIDVLAYWSDRDSIILYMQSLGFQIYEMLGGEKAHHITDIQNQRKEKRNIFCCKEGCELVQIWKTEENEIFKVDFHHIGQSQLNFIEFLFNDKTDSEFIYARNHNVKRKLRDAFLSYQGMPYLAPEICLLYKSTDTEREGYQQDYQLASSRMSAEQLGWLDDAIDFLYPQGHKWKQ
jgi:hypothetical protein